MKRTPFTASWPIVRKARDRAPSRTVSENVGRRGGYHDGADVTTRGYQAIVLYVRKGLGRPEIILPVVKFVFEVQQELRKPWTLVPLSHGWGDELKHLGTDLPMRYVNESSRSEKITDQICGLAGQDLELGQVAVQQLFPRTDARSLYGGKIKVTRDDLLVFVDFEEGMEFDYRLRLKLGPAMQRQVVLAEMTPELDQVTWVFAPKKIRIAEPKGPVSGNE
jgi:hypothetical protein